MNIKIASADSLIIYFSDTISKEVSLKVKSAYKRLKEKNDKGLIEIIPSYTSLFISYDIFKFDFEGIKSFLEDELKNLKPYEENNSTLINIDVYYGKEVGLDLERVASFANISVEEVIQIHSSKIYEVYAIGFLPGFAYLASIDEKIIVPRLESPRKLTPKGSVSIADNQTAIYPQNSPGGWNILGRTTFELFDKKLEELSPVSIDSKIKFNPISKETFLDQGGVI
ncbi:5-oxoprolinase subunit PxpB [Arcobacter sp. LA11]|uniref:5-oxoprolinase subunit PxpB n=1 Tax=Arcobacter sp. LA11 TaxID=1898176 RepID=UPI0009334699|nr:5-oxoprolinase subunit PxpB [Arcobacter sp. LA11]